MSVAGVRSRGVRVVEFGSKPASSSTSWSQVFRGWLGGRFQPAAGGVPVKASVDRCSACEIGVFLGNQQI